MAPWGQVEAYSNAFSSTVTDDREIILRVMGKAKREKPTASDPEGLF